MGQIEELPDDIDEAASMVPKPNPTSTASSSSAPTPSQRVENTSDAQWIHPASSKSDEAKSLQGPTPPEPASVDDTISSMNRHPLFMTSIDESDGKGGENIDLQALKALAYDGTPLEIADNFREQGNGAFREKRYADARQFYTQGITAVEMKPAEPPAPQSTVMTAEEKSKALELLLLNRAAANLALQNYRATTQDCTSALTYNEANIKIWFRLVTAQIALSWFPQATRSLEIALVKFPADSALLGLQSRLAARLEQEEKAVKERKGRQDRKIAVAKALAKALHSRGVKVRMTAHAPDMDDAIIRLVPDPLNVDDTSQVVYPVLFLFPLAQQSNLVKAIGETEVVGSWAEQVCSAIEAIWDTERKYAWGESGRGLELFMDTSKGGMVKIGKKVKLGKILSGGRVELVDGIVQVFIVPTGEAVEWVQSKKNASNNSEAS
ncbi:MAG: hypothetical protein M1814_002153 [Vezdaea aestivalis]|nr:MAG: hypothetical protein M1814_002153 [Vezdaea aestivalis]